MSTLNLKQLNAADWITSSRLFAVPVIVITTLMGLQALTGWIIFLALCTDMVDGFVARHYKLQSPRGAKLDSVADASLFLTSAFSIVWFFTGFVMDHLWEIALIMALYLFQLAFSFVRYGQPSSFHTLSAKIAAIMEGLFIVACFFYQPVEWLFYIILAIGLLEEMEEIALLIMLPKPKSNVKGLYWVLKEKR